MQHSSIEDTMSHTRMQGVKLQVWVLFCLLEVHLSQSPEPAIVLQCRIPHSPYLLYDLVLWSVREMNEALESRETLCVLKPRAEREECLPQGGIVEWQTVDTAKWPVPGSHWSDPCD